MKPFFTPKQVANAIGVSESSVKRWCDRGRIAAKYTSGGHRKIAVSGFLSYLRISPKHDLVNPRIVGLPDRSPILEKGYEETTLSLVDSLINGDEIQVRQIAMELFLANTKVAAICDEYFAPAFARIGELWKCGKVEIFSERNACRMSSQIINDLKLMVVEPGENAPFALGAAPEGDLYSLPTSMVELVLKENRWDAISMGENTSLSSIAEKMRERRPRLFWLSVSYIESEERFIAEYQRLHDEFSNTVSFAIGGSALTPEVRNRIKFSLFCSNMQQLANYVSAQPRL